MAEPAHRQATYTDLQEVPEHLVAELINGQLFTQPRPAGRHALAASALGGSLFNPFHRGRGGPGGWIILDEPELHLGGDALVPDLAGWRRERLPEVPDQPAFEIAPDWVCEVLSESTRAKDTVFKRYAYAREHVPFLWFIDPIAKTLEVFQLVESYYRVQAAFHGNTTVRACPFEAIELELTDLWLTP